MKPPPAIGNCGLLLFAYAIVCIFISQQAIISAPAQPRVGEIGAKSESHHQSDAEYRIKIKDLLSISMEGVCIYSPYREVDDRGKIRMLLIGEVQAEGKTVKELEAEIAAGLNKYVIDPKVQIRVVRRRT